VYDYVEGKVGWMAAGLPVEGVAEPFVTENLAEVATCGPHEACGDVAERVEEAGTQGAVVLTDERVVVGQVTADRLRDADDEAKVLDVMTLSPRTIRPSVSMAELQPDDPGTLVTTSEGVLLGAVPVAEED
jgi:ferredoxin